MAAAKLLLLTFFVFCYSADNFPEHKIARRQPLPPPPTASSDQPSPTATSGQPSTTTTTTVQTPPPTAVACHKATPQWQYNDFKECDGDRIEINDGKGSIDLSTWSESHLVEIFAEKKFNGGFDIKKTSFVGRDIMFTMYLANANTITVANNLNLEEFFLEIAPNTVAPSVRINGNRQLDEDSIELLMNLLENNKINSNSYIQIHGECDLENVAVGDVKTILTGCTAIYGDLIFDGSSAFPTDEAGWNTVGKLEYVQGCLRITGTKLTSWTDIAFLQETKSLGGCTAGHEISGNSDMCIHPPLTLKLKQIFKNMKIERNKQCKGECSNDHFQTYADPDCVIITDSLMINGNASQPVLSALKNVEEIRGVLEVANTNITDFNYLPKLTKLNTANYTVGAIIRVVYNQQLTGFDLPGLNSTGLIVPRENQIKFHSESNGMFVKNEDLLTRLNVTDASMIARTASPTTTTTTTTTTAPPPTPANAIDNYIDDITENFFLIVGISALPFTFAIGVAILYVLYRVAHVLHRQKKWEHGPMSGAANAAKTTPYKYSNPDAFNKKAREQLKANKAKIVARNKTHEKNTTHEKLTVYNYDAPGVMATEIEQEDYNANKTARKENVGNEAELNTLHLPVKGEGDIYGLAFQETIEKSEKIQYRTQSDQFCTMWFMNEIEPIYTEDFATTAKRMFHEPCDRLSEKIRFFVEKKMAMAEFGVNFTHYYPRLCDDKHDQIVSRRREMKLDNFWFANHWPIILPIRYRAKMDMFKEVNGMLKFERLMSKNQVDFVERMVDYMLNMPQGQCLDLTAADVQHFLKVILPGLFGKVAKKKKEKGKEMEKEKEHTLNHRPAGEYLASIHKAHVRIVGELRGDFDALRRVLNIPSLLGGKEHPLLQYNWVFLGNYTSRHPQSLETILFLLALQYLYGHDCIVLLRGVMEFANTSEDFGFKEYLMERFDQQKVEKENAGEWVWRQLVTVFSRLPMNCEVLSCIICTHSGFSDADKEEQIRLSKDKENTDGKPNTNQLNKIFSLPNVTVRDYFENADTGAGYYFGERVLTKHGWDTDFYSFFTTAPMPAGLGFFGDATPARLFTISSVKGLHGHGGQKTIVPCVAEVNGLTNRFTFHMMLEEDEMFYYDWPTYKYSDKPIAEKKVEEGGGGATEKEGDGDGDETSKNGEKKSSTPAEAKSSARFGSNLTSREKPAASTTETNRKIANDKTDKH